MSRSMRRIRRLAAVVALGGAVGLATAPTVSSLAPAAAQDSGESLSTVTSALERYGWWNKSQQSPTGGSPSPAPPDAPAEGIFIAHDVVTTSAPGPAAGAPALVEAAPGVVGGATGRPVAAPTPDAIGPTAYGAVRYSVPEGAEGQLVLRVASFSAAPTVVASVLACPTSTVWDGVQNGRFDQAPTYDCAAAVAGVFAGDTLTFDFPATLSTDLVSFDVALVPTGDQPFRLGLQQPTDANLILTSVPETFSGEGAFDESFADFDPTAEAFEDESVTTADELGLESSDTLSFADDGTSFVAGPTRTTAKAPTSAARGPGRQLARPAASALNPFAKDATRAERMMAVGLLFALAAGLWWVGGQPVRAPRLLGNVGGGAPSVNVAEVRTGGIGRFARTRSAERPSRLF